MTKIMLVEDDKSLREIYGVRLLAEGYDIVSAGDGEEALAVAIKERPGLIISDVMMPKISGFDMLDILRSTTETRNVKVIMMTALSSDEQRARGEQLGADRYLVKSQVGIEDVVRVVHEVLGDSPGGAPAPMPAPTAATAPTQQSSPVRQQPVTPAATPSPVTLPAPAPVQQYPTAAPPTPQPTQPPAATPPQPTAPAQAPSVPSKPTPSSSTTPDTPSSRNRVIQPINDPYAANVDINDLLDKELAKEAGVDVENRPPVATADQERSIINNQINQFENEQPAPPIPPPTSSAPQPTDATPPTDGRQLPPPPPRPPVAL